MTHLIKCCQYPVQVKAIQTTNSLAEHKPFDIHPKQSKPELINQLVRDFNLPHQPIFLQQVHENQVIEYTEKPVAQLQHQADACFTRHTGIVCAVMTADCLPVLLTDTAGTFVAAVHCGWRSLYAEILTKTLQSIKSPHSILAWFGPYIHQPQYEVDKAFVEQYLKKQPDSKQAFTAIKAGKSFANLSVMAQIQLNASGVNRIQHHNQCTFLNTNYYSWRENNTIQRMASMIWLDS